jgi:hypothetical protein
MLLEQEKEMVELRSKIEGINPMGEFSGNGERSTQKLQERLLSYRCFLLSKEEVFLVFSAAMLQQKENELSQLQ